MRVLADRHHADLYESLLRLFEDRLGWEVYAPIGLEWADAGIWDYANGHPGVTLQFLGLNEGIHTLAGDHYEEVWPQHPDRVQKLVTLDQFRAMRWDWLLASVTQHEAKWHHLAADIGARSILQVGNVGQPVDWGLSHVVLAAANIAVPEGRGVVYHPEFDRHIYRYEDPTDPYLVTSFMNCLPDAGQAYTDWLALQEALPEFRFREYGILGRDGIEGPSSRIGDLMREAGWAFHNKPQGDGYGFVIHQWASVGRPLVGRKSYYRNCLAAPLWRQAIDLDNGIDNAAATIRGVARDRDTHRSVAQATNLLFRIDFAAEAEAIRRALA